MFNTAVELGARGEMVCRCPCRPIALHIFAMVAPVVSMLLEMDGRHLVGFHQRGRGANQGAMSAPDSGACKTICGLLRPSAALVRTLRGTSAPRLRRAGSLALFHTFQPPNSAEEASTGRPNVPKGTARNLSGYRAPRGIHGRRTLPQHH